MFSCGSFWGSLLCFGVIMPHGTPKTEPDWKVFRVWGRRSCEQPALIWRLVCSVELLPKMVSCFFVFIVRLE